MNIPNLIWMIYVWIVLIFHFPLIADIASTEYQLYITEFGVKPNLNGFRLIDLSGNFVLLKDVVGIVDLKIITDRSNIELNAAVSEFTPFSDEDI